MATTSLEVLEALATPVINNVSPAMEETPTTVTRVLPMLSTEETPALAPAPSPSTDLVSAFSAGLAAAVASTLQTPAAPVASTTLSLEEEAATAPVVTTTTMQALRLATNAPTTAPPAMGQLLTIVSHALVTPAFKPTAHVFATQGTT